MNRSGGLIVEAAGFTALLPGYILDLSSQDMVLGPGLRACLIFGSSVVEIVGRVVGVGVRI